MTKMCLYFFPLVIALQSLVVAVPVTALFRGTVAADGASVTVTVTPEVQYGGYRIAAVFERTQQSAANVACLSPYLDLRYELRNGSGAIIPINAAALERPPFVDLSPRFSNMDCRDDVSTRVERSAIIAPPIYPVLPPGDYTLKITFAPRGQPESAALLPISLHIASKH